MKIYTVNIVRLSCKWFSFSNMGLQTTLNLMVILLYHPVTAFYSPAVNNLIDRLNKYCPYTDYCSSNGSSISLNENQTACCVPCSCQEDCWKKGDCCPDFNGTSKPPIEICHDTIAKRGLNDIAVYRGPHGQIDTYYVIDTCPETERSMKLIRKCRGHSKTSYEDFVWVSDTQTNKIYLNRFCAECNHVYIYEEWRMSTTCSDVLKGDYTYSRARIVPRQCRLIVVPPANIDVSLNRCVLPDATKCNATGRWTMHNKDIEDACHTFEQLFFKRNAYSVTVYRNVFCYLCDSNITGEPEGSMVNICPTVEQLEYREAGDTFTALLDHRFYRKPEEADELPCAVNEIFDPIQEKCRELSCPVLNAPFYGTCRRLALQVNSLGLLVRYRLHPAGGLSTDIFSEFSTYSQEKLGWAILRQFYRKFGFLNAKCYICNQTVKKSDKMKIHERTNTSIPDYYVLESVFITNEYCDDEFIIDKVKLALVTEMTVKMSGQTITFGLTFEQDHNDKIGRLAPVIFVASAICSASSYINLSKMKLCPTITLTRDEYFAMMNATTLTLRREQINSVFGINSGGSVVSADVRKKTPVCFRDYESVLSELNVASLVKLQLIVLITSLALSSNTDGI